MKSLYCIPEAGASSLNTYPILELNKLFMTDSNDDKCFFYIKGNDKSFREEVSKTNCFLILANNIFSIDNEKPLKDAKLIAKDREKLTIHNSIKFITGYIRLADDNSLFFSQKRLFLCLRLVTILEHINLISSLRKIRKAVSPKN